MASLRDAALQLFTTLDRLGIRYAVGGSFASSFHGIARATQDIDVVVELPEVVAKELYLAVSADFYADEEMILDAIRRGLSFNLIHLESGYKFDLFVAGRHPLGGEVSERQWSDLANLAEVQRDRVDYQYLKTQASRLGVAGLLSRLWGD